ncbi:UNVERIFIED_CONTAM: Cell morphogenesis protein PAG1, partial [Siphonaria sp. JEL0065]
MLQDSLASKMEYVAFNQLRYENPELVATNPTCKAHIDLNSEFLGKLSHIRFAKVSDGFVKEISELSKPVTAKDPNLQVLKLGICIRAMRFLKLKIYPIDCLEETAEFLMIFAGFFVNTHNPKIKHAYCDLFVELLEPVVAIATAEVNLPTWKEGIELIFGKAMRMIVKKGHMQHSLPLVTTALCLSRKEFFIQNLPAVIDICIQRLRDKQMKSQSLVSLTRLLWVCAHRNSDASSAGTQKRVESLLKHIFPPKSTLINPPDVALDLLTRTVYISMVKYMEPMMELFSMLMLGIDITSLGSSGSGSGASSGGNLPPSGSTLGGTIRSEQKLLNNNNMNSNSNGPASRRSDFSGSSGIPESVFSGTGGADVDFFLATANAGAGPKRQIIGMRAFIMLLADIEEALESSSSSGGQSVSPWSNGFGGGGGGSGGSAANSLSNGGATARSVVVQGKIKLLPPPFPSLNLSDKGDMMALASIQDRAAANINNSLAADHGIEASWVSNSSSKAHESGTLLAAKAANLGAAISNNTIQRMSNNVKIYLDRANVIFGSMLISLDKACGNHYWNSGREFGYMNGLPNNSMDNNGRRNSIGDGNASNSASGGSSNTIPTNITGTSVSDTSATSIVGMNKWAQYELLKNCIDCLPKLCPTGLTATRVVEMLSLYTFHTDEHVRTSSIQALLRIGRIVQGVSDGGGNNPYWSLKGQKVKRGRTLAEATTRIVCDAVQGLLLERATDALYYVDFEDAMMEQTAAWVIWKLTEAVAKDLAGLKVGEAEAGDVENSLFDAEYRGLLYLCSTTPAVRRIGVKMLEISRTLESVLKDKCGVQFGPPRSKEDKSGAEKKKITKVFDNLALNQHNSRLLNIIEEANEPLLSEYYMESVIQDNNERARQKEKQKLQYLISKRDSLLQMGLSDIDDDQYLWDRCFPDLAQYFLTYAHPVTLLRCVSIITNRLHFLNSSIIASDFSNQPGSLANSTVSSSQSNISMEPHHVANLSKVFGISATTGEVLAVENAAVQNAATLANSGNQVAPVSDSVLTQWRVYLKLACACVEIVDMDIFSPVVISNGASSLKPVVLFRMAVAYLFMERPPIRKSAVISIGGANWRSYKTIFEVLNGYMKNAAAPRKVFNLSGVQSAAMVNSKRSERFRVELTHVLSLLTDFMEHESYRKNETMFKSMLIYINWDLHLLRYHYCTLVERFYFHVRVGVSHIYSATGEFSEPPSSLNISKYFPFELRLKSFALLESWCGYGKQASVHLEIQSKSMIRALEAIVSKDHRDPNKVAETMNKQRATLQLAALKAMASLVHGPVSEPSSRSEFSIGDLHHWINDLYSTQSEEFHHIASAATQGLLIYNGASEDLMNAILRECYISSDSSIGGAVGYFTAIVNIYGGPPDETIGADVCRGVHREYPCAAPRLIALSLFKSGDPEPEIRHNALRLLRAVELRVWPDSPPSLAHAKASVTADERFLKDANYSSVSSPSAVYKRAQVLMSAILATERPDITIFIVSELCLRIEQVSSRDGIRDILSFLVPWVRNLQLASTQQPRSMSKVENPFLEQDADSPLRRTENFLTNLFYITVCFGDDFAAEVEALWTHLLRRSSVRAVNDLYLNPVWPEEVSLTHLNTIVDFMLALGVSRRNPIFIIHAKKLIAYLSRAVGCDFLAQHLLTRISPINFTPMDNMTVKIGMSQASVPYCIDINAILPETASRPPLTFGGLLSTFMVELVLQAKPETTRHIVPYIIHIIFIQLDHFISLICEQMKSLLIRLLQDLPLDLVDRNEVNRIVRRISEKEDRRLWAYEDISPDRQEIESIGHLERLVGDVLSVFTRAHPHFLEEWTRTALFFAVNCPVRHVACRSLQILRSLRAPFSLRVFGEMFLRFSTTAADKQVDVQSYSLEILITLHSKIKHLAPAQATQIPQLFWSGVAILSSPLEAEFLKGVEILQAVLTKSNFQAEETQEIIWAKKPAKWKGTFNGIQPLLIRGLQSKKCEKPCLELINSLTTVANNTLVDTSSSRLVASILVNFPRLMQGFESDGGLNGGSVVGYRLEVSLLAASNLSKLADIMKQPSLSRLLLSYSRQRFRIMEDFIQQFGFSIRDVFFPAHEAEVVHIISCLLLNKLPFYQKWSLRLLKMIIPFLTPDSNGVFNAFNLIDVEADLILPCVEALKSDSSDLAASVLQELLSGSVNSLNERFLRRNYSRISQESYDRVMMTMETGESKTSESKTGWRFSGDIGRASKVTRYNVASVVSTCGINNISTQIPVLKDAALAKPDSREDMSPSVVSYRIPPKAQGKVLLSEENKSRLLKSIQIMDGIFKDDEEQVGPSPKHEYVTVQISDANDTSENPQLNHDREMGDRNRSAFKNILSQSNVGVQVVIRLLFPFDSVVSNELFPKELAKELSKALVAEEGSVLIDRIADASLEDSTIVGTIVTVDLTGGGLLGNGKIAAAQAEELRALIMQNEDLPERAILWQGNYTSRIDALYEPKVLINFRGMTISYVAEGLRGILPHRQNLILQAPNPSDIMTDHSFISTTTILEPTLSVEKSVEALKIFPAAFELVIQLHADLIALIDDMNSVVGSDASKRELFEKMAFSILSVRNNAKGYCPALLKVEANGSGVLMIVDDEALLEAGHKLLN